MLGISTARPDRHRTARSRIHSSVTRLPSLQAQAPNGSLTKPNPADAGVAHHAHDMRRACHHRSWQWADPVIWPGGNTRRRKPTSGSASRGLQRLLPRAPIDAFPNQARQAGAMLPPRVRGQRRHCDRVALESTVPRPRRARGRGQRRYCRLPRLPKQAVNTPFAPRLRGRTR